MSFLYETHLHTSTGSACGVLRGAEYVKVYRDLGYTGIMVTDHFFRGNCAADRGLPWAEWVDAYCRGFEETREAGERAGLDVFFGWEETFHGGDDYLVYGLDKAWLKAHPEAARWTRAEQFQAVDAAGGLVVHAHPFRERDYIRRITLCPGLVHAVEAANAGNDSPAFDALAYDYARRMGLPMTAGTDIHRARDCALPGFPFGVYSDTRFRSIADYISAVKTRRLAGFRIPEGRLRMSGAERVGLPVVSAE
ncbi:MAG: PHP domain-containing protein [Treponema sp.]|jgi:histidinol phosphatase-like PHP family hydrolase|nr:PHP domain-containing protein [Treponema sp.]